jgi:peptide/nickel transport system substrate-binding protein
MHVLKRTLQMGTALAVTAVLSVALTGCGGSGSTGGRTDTLQTLNDQAQYNPQAYQNVRDGGTLTTALPEISPQFNLWQGDSTAYTRTIWNWYNPLLITFTADGKAAYNPAYLTDVRQDTVDGNTRVTYTINPKAAYNDGSPIDWHSFEAVWKANGAIDPAYIVSSSDGYDRISSVTPGVNDRQAVVTFRGINLWWQSLFNNLLNPKALDPGTFNRGYVNNPHPEWGAGPYLIRNFDQRNGTITFVRNPRWWGRPGKLDTRTFLTMEPSASINAFKNGQLDAVGVGTKDRLAQVQGMSGIDIRKGVSLQLNYLTLNGQSPILADRRVRKAVFEGIDRNQLEEITFQGLGFSEQVPGSMVLLPFQPGYQDNSTKVLGFNPTQAKADLDAAGWPAGPDGFRAKDGKPLEFTYVNTGDDPIGKAIAAALGAMLKNIGVRLNIRQVPSSEFSSIITGKKFDMFYSGVVQTDPFGIAYICQLYCSDSTLLKSGVNDPALDGRLRAVNTLPTPPQQYTAANAVETDAFKSYGVLPTVVLPDIVAVKHGLANYGAGRFFDALPETIGWQK